MVSYLLCFCFHRYQQIHDNLINCLIYQVRRYDNAARTSVKEMILEQRMGQSRNLGKAGQILQIFTDESIPKDTPFEVVQTRAFDIVAREDMINLAETLIHQGKLDEVALHWQYLDTQKAAFKRRLRPILRELEFDALSSEKTLLKSVRFLQERFRQGKSLKLADHQIPTEFIPAHLQRLFYKSDAQGSKTLDVDRYEFYVYRNLRQTLEAGDVFCRDSIRFRSFEDDLVDDARWQNKEQLMTETGLTIIQKPAELFLSELEEQLEQRLVDVNNRIAIGENKYIKTASKGRWSLPYTRASPEINHTLFDSVPDRDIQTVMQFVHQQTGFLDCFDHIVSRAVKKPLDEPAMIASLIAWGTNMGLGRMGNTSDMNYASLATTSDNYIRLETLKAANDHISNATADCLIFQYYDIGQTVHSSSDGQKFETRIDTINSRHSPKYFGLKKGIVAYTLVANHLPLNARIIGANEHESHYVFDLLVNNNTNIQPTHHSTDTHGTNQINFALLNIFGYQFAPRYKDLYGKVKRSLYGFRHPSQYDSDMLLRPIRKLSKGLIIDEWDNMQRIFVSLALKTTTQFVIVSKLSSYARKNRTKRALWELDNIFCSLYLLDYIDDTSSHESSHIWGVLFRHLAVALRAAEQMESNQRADKFPLNSPQKGTGEPILSKNSAFNEDADMLQSKTALFYT